MSGTDYNPKTSGLSKKTWVKRLPTILKILIKYDMKPLLKVDGRYIPNDTAWALFWTLVMCATSKTFFGDLHDLMHEVFGTFDTAETEQDLAVDENQIIQNLFWVVRKLLLWKSFHNDEKQAGVSYENMVNKRKRKI